MKMLDWIRIAKISDFFNTTTGTFDISKVGVFAAKTSLELKDHVSATR